MTRNEACEIVVRWYELVGTGANESVFLDLRENGKVAIIGEDGDVITLATDWDAFCEAETIEELAEILQRDIDEYEAVGE